MFTKSGIIELHATMHERLDLLFRHVATVPDNLHHKQISGFGHPSIWKQLVHILTCEEGWIHDLMICRTKRLPVGTKKTAQLWRTSRRQRPNTKRDTNLRRRPHGRATQHDPSQGSRGLGRRTPEPRFYPVARHNPRVSPQGPGRRDAANSRISNSGHRPAAGVGFTTFASLSVMTTSFSKASLKTSHELTGGNSLETQGCRSDASALLLITDSQPIK